MNAEQIIRTQARNKLKDGNWGNALGVFFVVFAAVMMVLFLQSILVLGSELIFSPVIEKFSEFTEIFSLENEESFGSLILSSIMSAASLLALVLGFLFLFPVFCGMKRYFFLLADDKETSISEVFYYFKHNTKSCILLGLRYGILTLLKLALCISPVIIIVAVIISNDFSTITNSILTLTCFITGFAGLAVFIPWISKTFLTLYLFISDDNISVRDCIANSKRILNSPLNTSVKKLFYSFGGWFAFALTGFGALYFLPYFETALATSAKWIIKLDKEVY